MATAYRIQGRPDDAAQALQKALSRHAPDLSVAGMMDQITRAALWPGWCGLSGSGHLIIDGDDAFAGSGVGCTIHIDGRPIKSKLPAKWRLGQKIEIRRSGSPLIGSPIDIGSVLRCEGFVYCADGALQGWLWHPGEPERTPSLTIVAPDGSRRRVKLEAFAEQIDSETPLARPRRLFLPLEGLPAGELGLLTECGTHLTGSPIDGRMLLDLARRRRGRAKPSTAGRPRQQALGKPPNGAFDVVIPVYRHLRRTLECIESVRETVAGPARIVVVEDASPEPALSAALDVLAADGIITLIRHAVNLGFPRSANAGIAFCAGRDVILLNSDTLVAPFWADALREAAYSAPDIGTATPFSNDASILSYPDPLRVNPMPDRTGTRRLMALARAANGNRVIDIPTGNGFCWYLRRDCLDQAGLLREDLFAQGYGEENEFCLRSAQLGWRHVGATGAFVGHVGNISFGAARSSLMRRNLETLNLLYPGYDALIQAHIAADPFADSRRRIDRLRLVASRSVPNRAVLLITHDEAGGVERVVRARARMLAAQGTRAIILRPQGEACLVDVPGADADSDTSGDTRSFPNLRYVLPREMDRLLALLKGEGVVYAEWHHLLGHHPQVRTLCERLAVPYDIFIHDYAWFCARIALVGPTGRYCGEPDIAGCNVCIAAQGSNLSEPISPAALVGRSAAELAGARAVIAPSDDAARRIARHFPGISPIVVPLEEDAPGMPAARFADQAPMPATLITPRPGRTRIGVIGGIGREKGYEILLACLHDASSRDLALDFVVIGHTPDDNALFEAGILDVTGAYREDEAIPLIRAQHCNLAFLPSIWPETWCFTLGLAWRAGLGAAVFDIGAQAERVRRTSRGAVLPLGLPVPALNDALLRMCNVQAVANRIQTPAPLLSSGTNPLQMVP